MTVRELETAPDDIAATGFRQRLAELLDLFQTRKSAAEVAGKSVDQLQAYLKGRSAVPFVPIARLCAAKGVSLDWLANGDGESGPVPESQGERRPNGADPAAGNGASPAYAPLYGGMHPGSPERSAETPTQSTIPVSPYFANTGFQEGDAVDYASVAETLAEIALPADLVRRVLGRAPERLATVVAVGEAMAPTIKAGDLCVVDTGDSRLTDGCLYALQVDRQPLLRRVARQASGGVRLIADQTGIADEVVPHDGIAALSVIGRVLWAGCAR